MADVYEGGIPMDGGKNLFPGTASQEAMSQPQSGPDATPKTAGGPPEMNGSYKDQFVDDASYQTGDMSVDNEPKMVVVNPDTISTDGTGKMP